MFPAAARTNHFVNSLYKIDILMQPLKAGNELLLNNISSPLDTVTHCDERWLRMAHLTD